MRTYYHGIKTSHYASFRKMFTFVQFDQESYDNVVAKVTEITGAGEGMLHDDDRVGYYYLADDWQWFYWYDCIFFREMDEGKLLMVKLACS